MTGSSLGVLKRSPGSKYQFSALSTNTFFKLRSSEILVLSLDVSFFVITFLLEKLWISVGRNYSLFAPGSERIKLREKSLNN